MRVMTEELEEPLAVRDVLSLIKPGNPVAEFDTALEDYFVQTETFERLITDEGDIVAGDKGTGKTALFKILTARYREYSTLDHVEVLSAFNPVGTPVFQRLVENGVLSEDQYSGVWKSYLFMLAGNWLLDTYESKGHGKLEELEALLDRTGLRLSDTRPASLFNRVISRVLPTSLEATTTFTPDGIPLVSGKADFKNTNGQTPIPKAEPESCIRHNDALQLLQECLEATESTLWLVFDRLDEAFQASPDVEKPALRALLRTYLDVQDLPSLRLKLFLRKDLFARVIEGGFVNLTHINARKITITWEDENLYDLLYRRIVQSPGLLEVLGLTEATDPEDVFHCIFPQKVDDTSKRPTTWNWMLTRIRDGNNVKSPRNLVDLFIKAMSAQNRRENQSPRIWDGEEPLITGESLKRALIDLSAERVEDTLIAEAGESAAEDVKLFENGKAEHDDETLRGQVPCSGVTL